MSREELQLPDVNVLVALTNASHVHHTQSHRWLAGVQRFATTPLTESGLLRLLLNPVVVGQTLSGRAAMQVLAGVRADPRATFLVDGTSLAEPSIDLVGLSGARQVPDWHLVNLAAASGARLVTLDRRLADSLVPADRKHVLLLD